MLIPIGQETTTVRRHPVVSYGIIALNFAVFAVLLGTSPGREWEERAAAKWERMIEHLAERPYLDLPPILAERCGRACRAALEEIRAAHARRAGSPPPWIVEEEQRRFDSSVEEVMDLLRERPGYRLGFVPSDPAAATLLSSMFVHAGWLHILGNMLFLLVSGPFVEDVFGRPLFTALYLLSGAAAAGAHAMSHPESVTPLVGASGAVAGVMGAFLVRLWRSRIRFLFVPILFLPALRFTFFLPAFVVLPLWLAEQLWYARRAEGAGGVAWWAHVGGFLFGAAVAAAVRLTRLEERHIHPAIEAKISLVRPASLERALEARTRGDWEAARREVRTVLAQAPNDLDARAEAHEIAVASGDSAEAARTALRLLELYLAAGERRLALRLARDALARVGESLPPRFHLMAASLAEKEGDGRWALELYEAVAARHPEDPGAFRALFRTGEILRRTGDLRAAREAFARARAHPACTEGWRRAVERALAELG